MIQATVSTLVRFFALSDTALHCQEIFFPNIHGVSCITNCNYYPNYTFSVLSDKSACLKLLVFDSFCKSE